MNFTILRFDSLESTNTEAIKQSRAGADEGLCVLAREQTAGRGRHGRTWMSPKDSGLYFSVVLRPKIDAKFLSLITLMTGVAVYDALAELGLKPDIKWVNDVLIGEKKISGILAETAESSNGLAVVVGVGINLTSANFSKELAAIATSVREQTGRLVSPDEMAESLTPYIGYFYDILNAQNGAREIGKEWSRRSSYSCGKAVRVDLENEVIMGVTDGLESNGALRVKKDDGNVAIVQAGYVEKVRETQ
jgi:BirA family transcriptional regulator, biotin operon repressor / biotin---[acetyl-CoA-carboxylase] ligase